MKGLRNIFGVLAATLLVGAFFLRWVRWSDSFSGARGFSGYQLAAHSSFSAADPWLFVFPAIAGFILLALGYLRLPYERVATGFGLIMLICCAAGFIFFVLRSNAWLAEIAPQMEWAEVASLLLQGIEAEAEAEAEGGYVIVNAGIGLYGTLLGLLCAGFSGIFSLAGAVKPLDAEIQDDAPFKPIKELSSLVRSPHPEKVSGLPPTHPLDPTAPPVDQEHTHFAWLIAIESDSLPIGSTFTIDSARTIIGRTLQNGLVLTDTSVSGRHAEIFRQAGTFTLFDLESSNGSFVYNSSLADWERISQHELKDGDRLKFGRSIFSFVHV